MRLARIETHAAELATKAFVEAPEHPHAGRVAEVLRPTHVKLPSFPIIRSNAIPWLSGEASKPLLCPLETFRRNAEPSVGQETVTEKRALPHGRSYGALPAVDLQVEPPL